MGNYIYYILVSGWFLWLIMTVLSCNLLKCRLDVSAVFYTSSKSSSQLLWIVPTINHTFLTSKEAKKYAQLMFVPIKYCLTKVVIGWYRLKPDALKHCHNTVEQSRLIENILWYLRAPNIDSYRWFYFTSLIT